MANSHTSKKRNTNPDEVQVINPSDFPKEQSLDEQVNRLMENRFEVFIHNLSYYLKEKHLTQERFCNKIIGNQPNTSQISSYKREKDIPLRTIFRVALACGYSPEQMCGQLLDRPSGESFSDIQSAPRDIKELQKYVGTYYMAYFSTDIDSDKTPQDPSKSISYGILSVYLENRVKDLPQLKVIAFTSCSKEKVDTLYQRVKDAGDKGGSDALQNCYQKIAFFKDENGKSYKRYFYKGQLALTENMVMLTMKQNQGNDIVQIQLHNQAAASSIDSIYTGGLGAVLSTSRGAEHMPCMQAVIFSRNSFTNPPREDLVQCLMLGSVGSNIKKLSEEIIIKMRHIFSHDETSSMSAFSDEDKEAMFEGFLEHELKNMLIQNSFLHFKIPLKADDEVYHLFR